MMTNKVKYSQKLIEEFCRSLNRLLANQLRTFFGGRLVIADNSFITIDPGLHTLL